MMTQLFLNQDIKIQSFSDIITNSSSELFCQITGDNLNTINEFLSEIIKGTDSEFDPTIYYNGDYINIDIPYGYSKIAVEFMKAGLKAILSDYKNINLNFDVEY